MRTKKLRQAIWTSIYIFFFIPQLSIAQNQEAVIKTQAMAMTNALLKKDMNGFIQYMHPSIIELAGGKEKMMQAMDTANKYMLQFGAKINRITIGNPTKIIHYKNELQTTLPQTTKMSMLMGEVEIESTLIALSADNGIHWFFIDTSLYNGKDLKKSLPGLSPDIVIPPMKPPKIIPAQ